ncbi:MAG: RNA 2',3'-cyclic phosphodiesterase [Candidatus Aenigmarchaeota archaeon]
MRCFISIDIEKGLINKVVEMQKGLRNLNVDVKFVEPGNLHFTVKFLGDVNDNEVDGVKKSLGECLNGENAFRINVNGIGYFGSPSHIRTLWLGLNRSEDELVMLMKRVNDYVKLGKRSFSPHLTIGRVKSGGNMDVLLKFLNESKNVNVGEMVVNNVKLKSSMLTKKGPIYSDLAVFKLRS